MSPRPYDSSRRKEAAEETRRKILEASLALHGSKGIAATTWQDIANAADVAVGTVYYHFPTLEELVPACSGFGMARTPPPTPEIFEGVRGRKARIETLVRAIFRTYAPLQGQLRFTLAERRTLPVVRRLADELLTNIRQLVRVALGDDADDQTVATVEALVDFRVWDSLQERGLDEEVIVGTVAGWIARVTEGRDR